MLLFLVILIVAMNVTGQLLLKKAANSKGIVNISLLAGYFIFFSTIVLSFYLMKKIDLRYFAVIDGMSYFFIIYMSYIVFRESINRKKIIGTLLVAAGVVVFMWEKVV